MARLIDADALIKSMDYFYNNSPFPHPATTWERGLELAADCVFDAPTVDAVPVIKCKDCKHYEDHKLKIFENCVRGGRCIPMKPYDFCSCGERRSNE